MNYDKILIKICFGQRLRFKKVQKIINLCPNIKNYLLNRFDYIESIKESLHRIKNNIEEIPLEDCVHIDQRIVDFVYKKKPKIEEKKKKERNAKAALAFEEQDLFK